MVIDIFYHEIPILKQAYEFFLCLANSMLKTNANNKINRNEFSKTQRLLHQNLIFKFQMFSTIIYNNPPIE